MALYKKNIIRLVLLTLLLFTILSSFQINNVRAQNTIGYTFQESTYIDWTNPIANTSLNVRNQTHYTDIYNGTYSFTYDINGTIPNGFNDISTLTSTAEVIAEYLGHNKVLELNDTDGGQAGVRTWISNITSGTVEFWVYSTGADKHTQFLLWDLTANTGINFLIEYNSGKFGYHNGSIIDITTHIPSNWYHIKIVYDFASDWDVYINGEGFLGLDWAGSPNKLDKIDILTELGESSYYTYLDAFGLPETGYNVNDNIIPYNYINQTQDISKWEFYNNENGTTTNHEQEVIPFWDELLTMGKIWTIEQFADKKGVRFDIRDNDHEGFERSIDVNNGIVRQINFTFSWLYSLGTEKTYTYFDIDSYDDTLIVRLRIDDDTLITHLKFSYYDGSSYVEIGDIGESGLMYLNITIINNIVICEYNSETAIFPILSLGKSGIGDVKIESYKAGNDVSFFIYFDSIGVYIDGVSQSNDYGNSYYNMTSNFDQRAFNFFNINATGNFSCSMSTYDFDITDFQFFEYQNASNISFLNIYDDYVNIITNPFLLISSNTSFTINSISLKGVLLTDGSNDYVPSITHSNINHSVNYFYVDSFNRLRFTLSVNDNDTEHIEINFNIPDLQTENYSVSFRSNMDGSSLGFLRIMYTDDTSSFVPFPTHLTTTNLIIPQTREIESIGILITDNDNSDNDYAYGYITELQLIWYLDMRVSIITLNLMMVIVPIIVLLVPTFGISARYGKNTILPVFILMSVICFATGLIPVWLFFVIMLSSGAFLFMKRKASSD